jgi:hypothetical protein
MKELLQLADFTPHVHTRFSVAGLNDYYLELTDAVDFSNRQLEQFSLNFSGVSSPWLPQGLYALTHPSLGECSLFLVPNGPDASGMRYQAAFSRFRQDSPVAPAQI